MNKLKQLVSFKKNDWGEKVRIIALSMDQDLEKLEKAIKNRGYEEFEHYSVRANKDCRVARYLGVKHIPYCSLIDRQGILAFSGKAMKR